MYFCYGWPKTFGAVRNIDGNPEDVVALHLDSEYCLVASNRAVQIWTGGKNRVKLGEMVRDPESLEQTGNNVAGAWCSSRHQLAVLTSKCYLLLFGIRIGKESVLHTQSPVARSPPIELKRTTIFLQHSVAIETAHVCPEILYDNRMVVLAGEAGELFAYTWQGKLRGKHRPLPSLGEFTRSNSGGVFPLGPSHSGFAHPMRSSSPGAPPPASPAAFAPFRRSSNAALPNGLTRHGSGFSSNGGGGGGEVGVVLRGMDYAPELKYVALVLEDGRVALCRVPDSGLHPLDQWSFSHWVCDAGSGARSVRLAEEGQLLAVGCADGTVVLHALHSRSAASPSGACPLRVLSLKDWGHTAEVTGPVAALRWSPDGRALAVGYAAAGLVVWSPSGCRLMCTLRQSSGPRSRAPSMDTRAASGALSAAGLHTSLPLEVGVSALAWGSYGYQLLLAEAGDASQILELSFAKSLRNSHRVLHSGKSEQELMAAQEEAVHVLQADDRLLLILEALDVHGSRGQALGLEVHHLLVPLHYIVANYPLLRAAISADGMDVAVAGRHGLALYSRRSNRWRVFGDVSQEREIRVQAIVWLARVVVVCAQVEAVSGANEPTAAQLLLYPRYHLDNSSLLARYPLMQAPLAVDAVGNYLLLASAPLDLTLLHVEMVGALTPNGTPTAQLRVVRELSILSAGLPLRDIALVAPQLARAGVRQGAGLGAGGEAAGGGSGAANGKPALKASLSRSYTVFQRVAEIEPRLCVLRRAGGTFSVLDMNDGSEVSLSHDVECFWLPAAPVWKFVDHKTAIVAASTKGSAVVGATGSATPPRPGVADTPSQPSTPILPSGTAGSTASLASMAAARGSDVARSEAGSDGGGSRMGITDTTLEASTTSGNQGNVEMPWWTYGAGGMQLWFPSTLGAAGTGALQPQPLALLGGGRAAATDPELEFDKEVYPIGISFAEVAIIGVTQRMVRNMVSGDAGLRQDCYPCFHPLPESQPVLPCLLRRLLASARGDEALTLALKHSHAPHFPRSLEWLLFTTLELDAEQFLAKLKSGGDRSLELQADKVPLVSAAAALVKRFPHFAEITVRVARKTDSVLWPVLFEATGPPSVLMEGLMSAGQLQTAACCVIIVDAIEGTRIAHALVLRLITAALDVGQYDLVAELVRYLLPPDDADAILLHINRQALGQPHTPIAGAVPEPARNAQPAAGGSWGLLSWWWGGGEGMGGGQAKRPDGSGGGSSGSTLRRCRSALDAPYGMPHQVHSPRFEDSLDVVTKAWHIIGRHAWMLLDQGCLRMLTSLGSSFAHLGPGLHSLLATTVDEKLSAQLAAPPSPLSVVSALAVAASEFPSLTDLDLLADATLLLNVCKRVGAQQWVAALALVLEDAATLVQLREAQPALWEGVREVVRSETGLVGRFGRVMAALEAGGSSEHEQGRAGSMGSPFLNASEGQVGVE